MKNISQSAIYLSDGKFFDNVSDQGFLSEYAGYKFKIDHFTYSGSNISGVVMNVEKPDKSIVSINMGDDFSGKVDKLELKEIGILETTPLRKISMIVYNLSYSPILQDGEPLNTTGWGPMPDWMASGWTVHFNTIDTCSNLSNSTDASCVYVPEYGSMDPNAVGALLKSISVNSSFNMTGVWALEEGTALIWPNGFRLSFEGYETKNYWPVNCFVTGQRYITLTRSSESYQILFSFTGSDNRSYSGVRLDEGPFSENDLFILNGHLYRFSSYSKIVNHSGTAAETVNVTLDAPINRGSTMIGGMKRYCDPENKGDTGHQTYTGLNCDALGNITIRVFALLDALKNDGSGDFYQDRNVSLESDHLFIGVADGFDLVFDESNNSIFFAKDFLSTDRTWEINGEMVGTFSDFQVNGYNLSMNVTSIDGSGNNPIVKFILGSGEIVNVKMSDREGRNPGTNSNYDNYVQLIDDEGNEIQYIVHGMVINDKGNAIPENLSLWLPQGGDKFKLSWGANDSLDTLSLCHPKETAYLTYFLGTDEEWTEVNVETTTTTTISTTSSTQHKSGDINGDGQVDYIDLLILADCYGKSQSQIGFDSRADLNPNGIVDYQDLLIIAANYG